MAHVEEGGLAGDPDSSERHADKGEAREARLVALDVGTAAPRMLVSMYKVGGPWVIECPRTDALVRFEADPTRRPNRWRGKCTECSARHAVTFVASVGVQSLDGSDLTDDREALDLHHRIVALQGDDIELAVSEKDFEVIELDREGNQPDSFRVYVEEYDEEGIGLWGPWEGLEMPDELIEQMEQWAWSYPDVTRASLPAWRQVGQHLVAELRERYPDVEFRSDSDQLGID
jgi:hypothetical protein